MSRPYRSWASSEDVRVRMRGTPRRDTRPELALRRAVHARGLRYRVSVRPMSQLRRTADLVFTRTKVAVFLDGCFWHGCPVHYRGSVTNSEYWARKISRNKERDADTNRRLTDAGWLVVRVWEHEDPVVAAQRVAECVLQRNQTAMKPGADSRSESRGRS
ncbi:very short patch repair endonuclease [Streptomyces griseorubiginosus]|uniref:very short patch repair endonuclease n=1 Tax=Streptomyces griseorubiginosus TaxID=67304 RepID=UPI00332D1935